eukprot:scaffold47_cov334-Pavlova_lutheri.AAC.51
MSARTRLEYRKEKKQMEHEDRTSDHGLRIGEVCVRACGLRSREPVGRITKGGEFAPMRSSMISDPCERMLQQLKSVFRVIRNTRPRNVVVPPSRIF